MSEEKIIQNEELNKEKEQLTPEELEQITGGTEQSIKHTIN